MIDPTSRLTPREMRGGPTDRDDAHGRESAEGAGVRRLTRFLRAASHAWTLRRVRSHAAPIIREGRSSPPATLAALLDRVLADAPFNEAELAVAIELHVDTFAALRRSAVAPTELAPMPLATLGYALGPEREEYCALLKRSALSFPPESRAMPISAALEEVQRAWPTDAEPTAG